MARAKTELFPERVQEMSLIARALGHPARLSVVIHLLNNGETSAMNLVRLLPLSQPATSRHLAVLKQAGVVRARDQGAQVYYSLQKGTVRALCQALQRNLAPKG